MEHQCKWKRVLYFLWFSVPIDVGGGGRWKGASSPIYLCLLWFVDEMVVDEDACSTGV